MKKQFVFLSGLPRTGSTLLSAILSQNPKIYSEGNSAVCQLMFDMQQSCINKAKEQLIANKRQEKTIIDMMTHIPYIYYKEVQEPIVLDKCRAWTNPINTNIIQNFIDKDFKIIILERNVVDIIKSFARIFAENNIEYDLNKFFEPNSEPLINSIMGLQTAKNSNNAKNFLFIGYEDLVNNPEVVVQKIYEFCGWEPFEHDFSWWMWGCNTIVNLSTFRSHKM
jgi:sulfotransferase